MNPYETLGLEQDASDEKIRAAYLQQALKVHPDKTRDDDATEKFQKLTEAYEMLSDPAKRARYDSTQPGPVPRQSTSFASPRPSSRQPTGFDPSSMDNMEGVTILDKTGMLHAEGIIDRIRTPMGGPDYTEIDWSRLETIGVKWARAFGENHGYADISHTDSRGRQDTYSFRVHLNKAGIAAMIDTSSGSPAMLTSRQSEVLNQMLQESLRQYRNQTTTQNVSTQLEGSSDNRPAQAIYAHLRSQQTPGDTQS
jgi:curved DNA-binding protein CbpA